ncbi:GDSL-type esterase/lipase family protein [Mucilaginibacter auburnensis]|uniref:Putative secreted protein (Por secretion system target) n=1 Tax=Mucilaginibacter auburnensis TaxID=1457233 RepID=A0A2H9VVS7_9SPHI|nr:GDSL-type esterase/lipase family protein [Mucilaginibacter auburnensis]PJJ84899.1 putative secreted protein (Por secretion system target) [Mucilaginibacter auburnensis]
MDYRKIIYCCITLCFFSITVYAQLPSCSAAARFYSKDSINVTTFGASTVEGVKGLSFQGFLKDNIQSCYTGIIVTVTTNGVGGETSTQGLKRYPAAIAGRTGFVLILIGANDAVALAARTMTLRETEANMRYYIETALKNNLIPIVGSIQFFNDRNSQSLRTANLFVGQINALYRRLAREYNVYFADINRALGRDFSLYQDVVHPNEAGYKVISFVWFDVINQAIEDKLLLIGLNQNYPNPASTRTRIGFSLSQAGRVVINLYNIQGKFIKNLFDAYQNAGYQETVAVLNGLDPGIYVYSMQVGGLVLSKKMIIVPGY